MRGFDRTGIDIFIDKLKDKSESKFLISFSNNVIRNKFGQDTHNTPF